MLPVALNGRAPQANKPLNGHPSLRIAIYDHIADAIFPPKRSREAVRDGIAQVDVPRGMDRGKHRRSRRGDEVESCRAPIPLSVGIDPDVVRQHEEVRCAEEPRYAAGEGRHHLPIEATSPRKARVGDEPSKKRMRESGAWRRGWCPPPTSSAVYPCAYSRSPFQPSHGLSRSVSSHPLASPPQSFRDASCGPSTSPPCH
mmetsp:Transcript_23860/g.48305  ORF Transcript_23860/g.48305 Transcript_23860/m.48305 type:complete len:200 (+) Transcript_23860:592-1191(+)